MPGDEQGCPPDRIVKWRRRGHPVWQYLCDDGAAHSTRVLAKRFYRMDAVTILAELRHGDADGRYEFRIERLKPYEANQ